MGKHRKRMSWNQKVARAGLAAGFVAGVCLMASDSFTPPANAGTALAQTMMISRGVITADSIEPTKPSPNDDSFLDAISHSGIPTAGREKLLLMAAKAGAQSHTTDDDLEQTVRTLFALDEKQAEKLVYQVRLAWPGAHDTDTDGSGR